METRITTAKEERRLQHYWNRIGGVANLDEPTSFWSIHPDATGGVAILTNPKTISETQLIEESKWTNGTVAIKSKGVVWINVYAPNKKAEREHFFQRLNEEFGTHRAAAVLGGDFNCVLDKQRDWYQRGVRLPVQCESAELRRLVTEWNIYDARELVEDPEWPVQREPTEHFTYWRKNSASRLDRFYIAGNLGSAVQWEAIELPKRYSDHQAVAIAHKLELMLSEGSIEWNHLEQRIVQAILRVSRAEKRQVRRYRQKLEDQQHRPANRTRRQLIEEQANAAREAAEFKFGKYMQATQGDVRHFFRRIANWQRDQTISRLEPTPGRYHSPNASLADIMGAEWHQITGQSHAAVPPQKAEQRFDALVYIPETRKVTEAQNQDLMAPITEKEVREAIAALHRHKAGGVDSLNNDFYKDCEDGVVEVLVREFNNIQRGAPMPRSFGQGIVIPLRKKGDSPNPLDYRPTTLLTTTYKLFAKVLATRLQDILLWIIGEAQQDFVRDRLMENAILIMQTALDKAYHNSAEGLDDAPGIAMLDFMKAYDTLDRDFLYLVLSKFGIGRQFVDLVRRMHSDTTAQYLVNGEVSTEWEVKSGIRQGFPLGPSPLYSCRGDSRTGSSARPPSGRNLCDQIRSRTLSYFDLRRRLRRLFETRETVASTHAAAVRVRPAIRSARATNEKQLHMSQHSSSPGTKMRHSNPEAWRDGEIDHRGQSLQVWRSDGRVGMYFGRKPEQTIHQLSEETRAFWPSFQWNDNPWIIDSQGEQYTVKTVPFLKECNLASLNVRREEERVFSVRLPTMTATLTFKRMTTLRKLVTSIVLCSLEIEIDAGNQLNSHQEPWSRKHTKREYKWISNGMGTIIASCAVSTTSRSMETTRMYYPVSDVDDIPDFYDAAQPVPSGKDRVFSMPKQCRMWGDKRNYLTHSLELQASTSRVDGLPRTMDRPNIDRASTNLFLPHIASRTAPPGQRSLLREMEKHFGFITPEHSVALQKLWFIVTSSIPVLLWRTSVEIVHERQHLTIEESNQRVWTASVMQVRAVAHRMRTLKGEKINATCLSQLLSVLERQDLSRQLEAWATARLYFDGGARGNPGPGGSGWALILLNERSNRWELKACGYAYMGPEVTDNWCEYSALKDGLAYSAHYLQHYEVNLEVFGDSQMIIAAQNGFSSIRQTK
ncbi:Rxlr effector protein, partial [Globisporangium splendens]